MTNVLRDQALRLALYLYWVGIDPQISGTSYREYLSQLTSLYCAIPSELRHEARKEGRRLIKEAGDLESAAAHLLPEPRLPPAIRGSWRRSYARHLNRMIS